MAEISLYTDPYYQDVVDDDLPKQIARKSDHIQEGLARLIHQYADKPRIKILLSIYLQQIQTCEDAIFSLIENANLDNATGWLLDALGRILVQPNPGLLEEDYRILLRVRIKALRSNGKPEELLEILRLILAGASEPADIEINEFSTVGILIKILSTVWPVPFNPDLIKSILQGAHAGGIPLQLLFSFDDSPVRFSFSGTSTSITGSATGLGSSLTPATGGTLSSVR